MDVVVVGVALADIALQTVDGEIHLGQAHSIAGLLLAEAGEFVTGSAFPMGVVLFNKGSALYEHAARAAGRVKHLAW